MARTAGSRFEDILPLFKSQDIGAMNWGFVSGKTQTIFPWGSKEGSPEPAVWFHDVLRPDGAPYIAAETELIRKLAGKPSAPDGSRSAVAAPFHAWALTPPLGWNSWDSFGQAVTEDEVKANADFMAAKLAKLGWRYIVVDIEWSEPQRLGPDYPVRSKSEIDAFGRFVPAVERFPSSAGGRGFKPLADYVHRKGLSSASTSSAASRAWPSSGTRPSRARPIRPPTSPTRPTSAIGTRTSGASTSGSPARKNGTTRFSASSPRGASISSRPTTSATGARRSP